MLEKNVPNLSSSRLSNLELTILAHGLDYCIRHPVTQREKIYSEFKVLFVQIKRLQPVYSIHVRDLKTRLNNLAHLFSTLVSYSEFKQHSK